MYSDTLQAETEVAEAFSDGIDRGPIVGEWRGLFRRAADGAWTFDGTLDGERPPPCFEIGDPACAVLNTVREYWHRRGEAEMLAARVAEKLAEVKAMIREHKEQVIRLADVIPVDNAGPMRSLIVGLGYPEKDIKRLAEFYRQAGDAP